MAFLKVDIHFCCQDKIIELRVNAFCKCLFGLENSVYQVVYKYGPRYTSILQINVFRECLNTKQLTWNGTMVSGRFAGVEH